MADYDDTNRGVLFRSDKKESDKHPDYTGKINVDGTNKRLAAWINESAKGVKYMSIIVSDLLPQGEDQPVMQQPQKPVDLADDIPF